MAGCSWFTERPSHEVLDGGFEGRFLGLFGQLRTWQGVRSLNADRLANRADVL